MTQVAPFGISTVAPPAATAAAARFWKAVVSSVDPSHFAPNDEGINNAPPKLAAVNPESLITVVELNCGISPGVIGPITVTFCASADPASSSHKINALVVILKQHNDVAPCAGGNCVHGISPCRRVGRPEHHALQRLDCDRGTVDDGGGAIGGNP